MLLLLLLNHNVGTAYFNKAFLFLGEPTQGSPDNYTSPTFSALDSYPLKATSFTSEQGEQHAAAQRQSINTWRTSCSEISVTP